jgi:hypothetical protein
MKLVQTDIGEPLRGIGPLGLEEATDASIAPSIFNKFISGVIGIMTVIAIIWLVFLLITGAYGFMTAGGDKAQLETARKRIFTGIVGFVIVIAAVFIVDLIGKLFGIDNILNPAELLIQILPY